jgi:phosphatidylserine decarboxylase
VIAHKSIRYILPPFLTGLVLLIYVKIVGIVLIGFSFYLLWFFRDPQRKIVFDDSLVYAAADGKILYLDQRGNVIKIGIRMSPFDVHLNRSPITGKVISVDHIPGTHSNVYFGDIENKNERNLIKIAGDKVNCDVLQITGAFARRIECWINQNETIEQGQKIGIIRFGSQTNMYIDADITGKSIKPLVKKGDKVNAGLTAVVQIQDRMEYE